MSKDEYNSEYQKLLRYVYAAADFADSATKDLTKGRGKAKYSTETVLALSKFIAEHNSFNKLIDEVQKNNVRLN